MKAISFFKGLSWLVLLNLSVKPVWIFAIDRQVQNEVGHENYGSYFSLLNLSIILLFLADAGLSNMLTQQLAAEKKINHRYLLKIKAALLLLYIFTCCICAWLTNISDWTILLYIIGTQALGSLFLFMRSVLAANQLFKTNAFFSVADKALVIILCTPFLYGCWQPITLQTFLQIQLCSTGMVCLLAVVVLLRKQLFVNTGVGKGKEILRLVSPFALIILLMGTHYRLDGFLLERLRHDGALQAGIYAASYRLLDASNMPGYLIASFLVAFTARNRNNERLIASTVTTLQHVLIIVGCLISCFVVVFACSIQNLLYNDVYKESTLIMQLCLAVLPAYYAIHLYGSVLTATASFRQFISILIASVLVNACANLVLIPAMGAKGCCLAALMSQYFCAAGCYFAATKQLRMSKSWLPWLLYFILAVIFLGVCQLIKNSL